MQSLPERFQLDKNYVRSLDREWSKGDGDEWRMDVKGNAKETPDASCEWIALNMYNIKKN